MTSSPQEPTANDMIDQEAMDWYLRLRDSGATRDQCLQFEQWLVRDPRHGAAYERAERLWAHVEVPKHRTANRPAYRPRRNWMRVRREPWLAAACLLLMLVAGGTMWRDPGLIDRAGADIATRPGESQTVTLADGSTLFLDFDSAVEVSLSEGSMRRLELLRGRVYLDVASNGRPFMVDGDGTRVRVMGTRFGVERGDDRVQVTVEEGQVLVSGDPTAGPDGARVLSAGEQVLVENGRLGDTRKIDAGIALAWVRGQILFDRAGIADIAAQLERMVPGRVEFDRASLEDFSLSGSFPADNPQAIFNALDETHGIRAKRIAGTLTWLYL